MCCPVRGGRVETGSKQQINIFMAVMEKYVAGQERSRTLLYYHRFDFSIFQRPIE